MAGLIGGESPLNRTDRLGPRWLNQVKALIGLPAQRRLAQAALLIEAIRHHECEYEKLNDGELRQRALALRGRARGGEALDRLLPETYGMVCVASLRALGLKPFDVQLAAGVVLHQGALAELATGEGKTLVAAFPVALNALVGKGAHVTTVNDYLARRDADFLRPVFQLMGFTLGVIQAKMEDAIRAEAYRCDITYGTASEFGFDFLRDRLKLSGQRGQGQPFWAPWSVPGPFETAQRNEDPRIQRPHYFALVDEADSVFIDEARTPLIIASSTRLATPDEQVVFRWADQVARTMELDQHFRFDPKKDKVELTELGRQLIRWSRPPFGPHSKAMDKLGEQVEKSLHAHFRYRRDQHYMIEENKVVIIDEYTGRRQPDRHWRDGLHQAVEAKEAVPINLPSDHAAQITFQSYFKLYEKLAGMTGTAAQNWYEIRRVYKLWVVCVPTNKPVAREQYPDRVCPNQEAKFAAVAEDVKRLHAAGRPVLVGTRSVEKSEELSNRLKQAGIPHQVLSAKQHEQEAQVVSRAGERGKVTIATNMAGRGTDIRLGPGVAELGGLHVLGTERHDARRIDRQLAGRSGRQGDPGSCQFYLALDDELLEGLGPDRQQQHRELGQQAPAGIDWQKYARIFLRAQKRVERKHRRQRIDLMTYEKHRQEVLKDLSADPYVD